MFTAEVCPTVNVRATTTRKLIILDLLMAMLDVRSEVFLEDFFRQLSQMMCSGIVTSHTHTERERERERERNNSYIGRCGGM